MERCYTHGGPCANWSVLFVSTWPAVNMDTSSFEVILAHSLSIRPKRRRNFTFCPPWLQKTSCGVYGLLRRRDHLLSSKLNHTYLLTYVRTYLSTSILSSFLLLLRWDFSKASALGSSLRACALLMCRLLGEFSVHQTRSIQWTARERCRPVQEHVCTGSSASDVGDYRLRVTSRSASSTVWDAE